MRRNPVKAFINFVVAVSALVVPAGVVAQVPLRPAHKPSLALPAAPAGASAGTAERADLKSAAKPPQTPIARINGVVLTQAYLDEELQRLFPYYAIHGGKVPAGAEVELRQQALHDAVLHELVYQEARRRNLRVSPAKWNQRVGKLRGNFDSRQAFEAAVKKKYGSVQEFERRLRRAMLVEQLWDAEVTRKSARKPCVLTTRATRPSMFVLKPCGCRPSA
jgi:hypothetical protein